MPDGSFAPFNHGVQHSCPSSFFDSVLDVKLADQVDFLEQFTQGCLFLALVSEGKRDALIAGILCWKVIPKRSSSF